MENKDIQTTENKATFAQKVGRFVGAAFFSVSAGCIMALLVALTVKLIGWIF